MCLIILSKVDQIYKDLCRDEKAVKNAVTNEHLKIRHLLFLYFAKNVIDIPDSSNKEEQMSLLKQL